MCRTSAILHHSCMTVYFENLTSNSSVWYPKGERLGLLETSHRWSIHSMRRAVVLRLKWDIRRVLVCNHSGINHSILTYPEDSWKKGMKFLYDQEARPPNKSLRWHSLPRRMDMEQSLGLVDYGASSQSRLEAQREVRNLLYQAREGEITEKSRISLHVFSTCVKLGP